MVSLVRDWQEVGTGGDNTAVPGIESVGDGVMPGGLAPSPPTPLPRWGRGGKQLLCQALSRLGMGMG
ncbi:hypothetical protein LBMAG46_03550 [Planctomycetia bacterium]|nr:hypothetical protein LBMAG46_03550 [Planctomycetia bacterium]